MPELILDFADTSFKAIKRKVKEMLCVECFMYKHEDMFEDASAVCNDCNGR